MEKVGRAILQDFNSLQIGLYIKGEGYVFGGDEINQKFVPHWRN